MRRRFAVMLAIYCVAHAYIWWRLVWPQPWPLAARIAAAVAIGALGASFPLASRRTRHLPRDAGRTGMLVGYVWFGCAAYLLLGAAASHVAAGFGANVPLAAQLAAVIALSVVALGFVGVARGPIAKHVRVPIAKLAVPGYRIVQLSDVHVGKMIGRELIELLVQRVNALEPDLIVITGDLIDGRLSELQRHVEPLRDLRARDGVYAVPGNHEYYWNAGPWLAHLRSLGIHILRNERVTIAGVLELAGTDDPISHEDVAQATAGRNPALPLVLLAHRPRTITRAQHAGVDLQLSGHTHGGQLLPWGWLARLWDPKVAGLARFGRTWLYVSEGTGYWGPPLRVGTRCEISVLALTPSTS